MNLSVDPMVEKKTNNITIILQLWQQKLVKTF